VYVILEGEFGGGDNKIKWRRHEILPKNVVGKQWIEHLADDG
jgi:hypothetical protein